MKIAVIGAGNMGSAIVRGLWSSGQEYQISVSDPSEEKLLKLKEECIGIDTTTDNRSVIRDAQVVIIAVKPWIFGKVATELVGNLSKDTIIVSIVAGKTLDDITSSFCKSDGGYILPAARIIPDTAISVGYGMTFISTERCDDSQKSIIEAIFNTMGNTKIIEERLMPAATALSSCGIAYVYKLIQAYVQAGVEMGMYPADALEATLATFEGAIEMLQQPGATVQGEIDRVTTPGGMTIRGINEMEHEGVVSAIIKAIKKPLEK